MTYVYVGLIVVIVGLVLFELQTIKVAQVSTIEMIADDIESLKTLLGRRTLRLSDIISEFDPKPRFETQYLNPPHRALGAHANESK